MRLMPSLAASGSVFVLAAAGILGGCGGEPEGGSELSATGGVRTVGGSGATGGLILGSGGSGGSGESGGSGGSAAVPSSEAALVSELGNAFGTPGATPPVSTYTRAASPGPTETSEACNTTQLTGTFGGEPIDELYPTGGTAWGGGTSWSYSVGLASGSALVMGESAASVDFDTLAVGSTLPGSGGRLVLPRHLQATEQPSCVKGPTSFTRQSNHVVLELGAVGYLPTCAEGTPVPGELTLCQGDTCEHLILGQIEGASYDDSGGWSYSGGGSGFSGSVGQLSLRLVFQATDALHAVVATGWITDNTSGAVYCTGATSTVAAEGEIDDWDDLAYKRIATLRDLRRVGSCEAVQGSDQLTVRACR